MYLGVDEIILVRLSQVLVLAPIPRSASVLAGDATIITPSSWEPICNDSIVFTAFSPYLLKLLPIPRLTYCQSAGCSANLRIFDSCAFLSFTSAGEVHTRHMPIIHHVLRHPTRTRSRHSPSRPPLQRPMSRVLTLPAIMNVCQSLVST